MTIKEMHDMIDFLKNEGQSGYHTPEEVDRALNLASDDKLNEERKLFETTGHISSNLRPFKKKGTVSLTSGLGDLPADYDYPTNASTTTNLKIDIVPEGEWIERLNDPIDVVSATNPICTIRTQIEVSPSSLSSIYLYYLKRPATMVFGYTEDGDDFVYDSGSSTQCDWPSGAHADIVRRACVYLGISLSDEGLVRLETLKKQTENA